MAQYIARKTFNLKSGFNDMRARVEAFLFRHKMADCVVEVTVYPEGRMSKREAAALLRKAMYDCPLDWEHGDYNFLFSPGPRYHRCFWRGRPVRLTEAEQLWLYRRLVRGEKAARHVLRDIRRRLGREFLDGVTFGPPSYNVDYAFPDDHERNKDTPAVELARKRSENGLT